MEGCWHRSRSRRPRCAPARMALGAPRLSLGYTAAVRMGGDALVIANRRSSMASAAAHARGRRRAANRHSPVEHGLGRRPRAGPAETERRSGGEVEDVLWVSGPDERDISERIERPLPLRRCQALDEYLVPLVPVEQEKPTER